MASPGNRHCANCIDALSSHYTVSHSSLQCSRKRVQQLKQHKKSRFSILRKKHKNAKSIKSDVYDFVRKKTWKRKKWVALETTQTIRRE